MAGYFDFNLPITGPDVIYGYGLGVDESGKWVKPTVGEPASGGGETPTPSGGGAAPPPPPPPPAPLLPTFRPMTMPSTSIKVAPSDIIQFDDSSVEIALLQDLVFEDIGATELANMSRADLIDGQEVSYSAIRNLSTIRREFNPNNIIATSYTLDYFSRFGIDLLSRGMSEPYFNENGDLVIEVDFAEDDEEIQVQVLSSGIIENIEEL